MKLLHFDTETRKAIVSITRTELLDMDAQFLGRSSHPVIRTVSSNAGEVELHVEEDER